MSDSIQRLCKKCNTSYPLSPEFWHKDKKAKDGLSYACKECAKAKSRQWQSDNQERSKQQHAQYYVKNIDQYRAYRADNAEKIAQQKREWRKNNPSKVKSHKKCDYEKRKSNISAYHRRWAKANPEKTRNNFHLRRARKAGNGGDGFTKADRELQLRSQKGLCWWCSKPMGTDITEDHVIPISKGGKHDPRNVVLAHKSCNSSKGAKLPQDWAGRLF